MNINSIIYQTFDRLTFKQKIISGFVFLSSIMILGMSYMLFEFTHLSDLSNDLIKKYQPLTIAANEALEHAYSATNLLHEHLLMSEDENFNIYSTSIKHLRETLEQLSLRASGLQLLISREQLNRLTLIIEEINSYVLQMKELHKSYEKNNPVISLASAQLNPSALEYQGLINEIIGEADEAGLSREVLLNLANMRYSWTQMMSQLRIALATRNKRELINVNAYIELNGRQLDDLRTMKLDLGVHNIEQLGNIRNLYLKNLEKVVNMFDSRIWRRDAYIMATQVMPLFEELKAHLRKISTTQLNITKNAAISVTDELGKVHFVYVVLIISGVVFAIVISAFITRGLTRPLKTLVTATRGVAEGNFEIQVTASSNDEIAQLSNSFNKMVSKLKQSQTELITAKNEAVKASHIKSKFLTSMSHELRTPLNAILGYAQLLEMDKLTKDQNHSVKIVIRESYYLLSLINQVLDLSQIESGHLDISMEPVCVADIVNECVPIIERSEGVERNVSIANNITDQSILVMADKLSLRQVLINILSNAIKYSHDGGNVSIDAKTADKDLVYISITDTGHGIPQNQIDKLFEPFERLDFRNSSIEGSGIGLTISRRLMYAMHGRIDVKSAVKHGSTFSLVLSVANTLPGSASVEAGI